MLGYYIFIGLIMSMIFLAILVVKKDFVTTKHQQIEHYFILVKNKQLEIEGVIRSINYKNMLRGRPKKISIFDYGSTDDSIAIFEKMLYPKRKIDYLYKNQSNDEWLLDAKIKESEKIGERQIIINMIREK